MILTMKSSHRTLLILCGVFFLLLTGSLETRAQEESSEDGSQEHYIAEVRPGPKDKPVPIKMGIVVIDIDSIDGANQTFVANFAILADWKDPRLAQDVDYIRVMDVDDVWTPNIQILNQQKLFGTYPAQVEVSPDGSINYIQRYWGTLSYPMNLKDFPFDSHNLEIKIVTVGRDKENIDFSIDEQRTGMSDLLTVTDFEVAGWEASPKLVDIGPDIQQLPGVVFEFEAKRLVGFYIIKVLIPLIMIVFMSLIVLIIDPTHIGPRFSIAITSILTLIAYRFLLGNLLPRISYLTHMDYFLFGSMFLVFMVLVETSVIARLMSKDEIKQAKTLDYWSRYAFVVLFIVILAGSFVV